MENIKETKTRPKHFTSLILLLSVVIVGIVYVAFTITPSHYGAVLTDYLGLDYEPLAGEARSIRGDEYSVVTPYFQIAVNNDFQRFNQNSPYGEDLRHFFGLPLQDWALVFKPYMWGFWIMGAARAFSLYHYFMIAAFLIGFTLFLNRLRLPISYAAIIAAILFFSHHNQAWWSNNASLLALTVWLILPFLSKWSYPVKFLSTFYISMMVLLALIYPSWQISLVYTFVFLALAFRRDSFRIANVATCGLAFFAACGLTYFYLQDAIPLVQNTIYPGTNTYSGGASARYFLWAQLAPHGLIRDFFEPIIIFRSININEVSTVSSLLLSLILSFTNYAWVLKNIRKNIWKYIISITFLIIVLAWMFLPIPSELGRFLLLDRIGPHRFVLAFGTFVVVLSALAAFYAKWVLSWFRICIYSAITLSVPIIIYAKQNNTIDFIKSFDRYDIFAVSIAVLVIILKFVSKNISENPKQIAYAFVLIALLYNLVSFSHFNPLQQASDIFSEERQAKIALLKSELNLSKDNLVAFEGKRAVSAALSALGLPTLHHTFLVPELEYFKKLYPELSTQESNILFNRFAKVGTVDTLAKPVLFAKDLVGIPGKSAATQITVLNQTSLNQYEAPTLENTSLKQAYIQDVQWSEVSDGKRFLRVDFYNPTILNIDSTVAIPEFTVETQKFIEMQQLNITASVIAKPNLKEFLTTDTTPIEALTVWQLYLEFDSQDSALLSSLGEKLTRLRIQDSQSNSLLYPVNNLNIEVITTDSPKVNQFTQIPQGNIDQVRYEADTKTLTVKGWTPVEDMPTARWIGYRSSDNIQLISATSTMRADVPLSFGKHLAKGFELTFDVSNSELNDSELSNSTETVPIPLCLYSSTTALGAFPISARKYNLQCSVNTYIETLREPLSLQNVQGKIDVVHFDEAKQTLTIKGWAPRNQASSTLDVERWFGYTSEVETTTSTITSFARPDVAKAFGEAYALSGFELVLDLALDQASNDVEFPIQLCLFGRSNELGDFYIPSDQGGPMLACGE